MRKKIITDARFCPVWCPYYGKNCSKECEKGEELMTSIPVKVKIAK